MTTCQSCRFWRALHCYRHAPIGISNGVSQWPPTMPGNWCGDHEPVEDDGVNIIVGGDWTFKSFSDARVKPEFIERLRALVDGENVEEGDCHFAWKTGEPPRDGKWYVVIIYEGQGAEPYSWYEDKLGNVGWHTVEGFFRSDDSYEGPAPFSSEVFWIEAPPGAIRGLGE